VTFSRFFILLENHGVAFDFGGDQVAVGSLQLVMQPVEA
jgi:hypothetical protein